MAAPLLAYRLRLPCSVARESYGCSRNSMGMAIRSLLPAPFEESLATAALAVDAAGAALARRMAELESTDLWSCEFAVVDIETTGSVAGTDAMTEIAIVRVKEGRIVKRWRSFVNPQQPIPSFITQLTGITDAMVASAPHVRDVIPAMLDQ